MRIKLSKVQTYSNIALIKHILNLIPKNQGPGAKKEASVSVFLAFALET
jgi:hypothetical protein